MASPGLSSTTSASLHRSGPPRGALLRFSLARAVFGAPALFTPVQRQAPAAYDGVTVLAHGAAPTVAYYFRSRLAGQEASFIDTRHTPPSAFSERELAALLRKRQIILVRHISPAWLQLLTHRHGEAASLAYFMDDDLPGAALDPHLPWRYALRLSAGFRRIRPLLAEICDQVLVSTPALAARYPQAKATVLSPLPLPDDNFTALDMNSHWSSPIFAIFYHGTASHPRELAFVADVARIVQAERHDTIFEVFGPREARRSFAGVPRVRKLHSMPWEDYLAHARATPMHIGLAPLLDTHFNAFRAATKVFDITRCRAVGLYSDAPPFNAAIQNHHSGILLKENPQAWAEEILNLLKRSSRAGQMAKNAAEAASARHTMKTDEIMRQATPRAPDMRKQSACMLRHAFSGWHILEAENTAKQDVLLRLYPDKNPRGSRLKLRLHPGKTRKIFLYLKQPGSLLCAAGSRALSEIRLRLKWCFPFFAKACVANRLRRGHQLFLGMPDKDIFRRIRDRAEQNSVTWSEACLYYYFGTLPWCASTYAYKDWIRFEESLPRVSPDTWPTLRSGEPVAFGIVLRTGDVPAKQVDMAVASIMAQQYPHWRLYVVGGLPPDSAASLSTPENAPVHIQNALAYPREKYSHTLLMDADTRMRPETLTCLALAAANNPEALTIYADEDRIDSAGQRFKPYFKPAWNPDLFLTRTYFSMPLLLRADFAQDMDLSVFHEKAVGVYPHLVRHMALLNATTVARAPWVLFHKQICPDSADSAARLFAADSRHLAQWAAAQTPRARVESDAATQTRRLIWELPDPAPLVSILVPTRDKMDVLLPCVQGILNTTSYRNFELLILDNDSREVATREFFREIAGLPKVRVLSWNHPFNYSAINNFGATQAKGTLICLCNNDIEPINAGWLMEMVSQACRPEVGCVGAKLYYPDGTIQHGGIVLGVSGIAGHAHRHSRAGSRGYHGRLLAAQNFSAVTGACLVLRKSIYEAVGGLNERDLPVAFNDVDLCLRVQALGYRNLWTPHAELYHREMHSRGRNVTLQQTSRAQKEADYMRATWGHLIYNDPFYSPNLTLGSENFGLRYTP